MKKTSVSLVVLMDIPKMGGRVALLNIRGEFNLEKMDLESWPGACQVTVHGRVKGDENIMAALAREFGEELGAEALKEFVLYLDLEANPVLLIDCGNENERAITYGMNLPASFLDCIPLSIPHIRFLPESEAEKMVNLRSGEFDKEVGVLNRRVTALFADEIRAIQLAFEKVPRPSEQPQGGNQTHKKGVPSAGWMAPKSDTAEKVVLGQEVGSVPPVPI